MFTLKKAFEYQNYLKGLLNRAMVIINTDGFVTTTKEKHLRSRQYSGAQDEEIIVKKPFEFDSCSVNQLISLIEILINESEKLTNAINSAKHFSGQDFDAMIANNSRKREFLNCLIRMSVIKPMERKDVGVAQKFNESGEQVSYKYDVEVVKTIDFDRKAVKAIINKLRNEVDEISQQIDALQITTQVFYEPPYQIGDTLEDIIADMAE